MSRKLAALISLAVVFSWSFALSTQSVEAKTPQHNPHRDRDYLVPPPPPYAPSIVPSATGMKSAQGATADTIFEKSVNPYSNYTFKRDQGDMPQGVQTKPPVSYDPGVEKKIQKHIDYFDSEISGVQKEISKLLDL